MLENKRKFHFIGIGGAGMSAIAKVLLEMGYSVSGSDLNKSETTLKLEALGATIHLGHAAEHVQGAEAVVISTAIPATNPELVAAKAAQLAIYHRADVVAALMATRQGIAVAGAHGKTTTTSMIAVMLEHAGVDPTVIIGGEVDYLKGNAKLGGSVHMVAEADESDGSFLKFSPRLAVVTNIENDHMDFYGTMENILKTFHQFLHKLPEADGLAVLCFDNAHIRNLAQNLERRYISYAVDQPADYTARNIRPQGAVTVYDVYHQEERLGSVTMSVPGRHNVANSLAAVIVGLELGLTLDQISGGLARFQGAKRRFQTKARLQGVWVVDDYAHHPTEIATTLQAARQTEPKRLICVFQPHRYSRTQFLQREFGSAFAASDLLILTDIYSAGEAPIPGISGETIKQQVELQTKQATVYIPDKDKIARYLAEIVEPGDLVITMGAGNIYQAGEALVELLMNEQG